MDWEKPVLVLDLPQVDELAKGQYGVHAILSPENQAMLRMASSWVMDGVIFEVK